MVFQVPHRPGGRSVWLGKDLAQSEDWIFRLPPAALAEIDVNLRRLADRDPYGPAVSARDFPLASIAPEIADLRREIATGRGFAVIRGLQREKYGEAELGLIFRGFGAHF